MTEASNNERENAFKQALITAKATIRQLLEENAELRRKDDLAIIGMACRFPGGANDPDRFWTLIRDGGDAISEVPVDRWPAAAFYSADYAAPGRMYTARAGFLDHPVKDFDAGFFGIAPREARALDPQHRLLMEVAWETVEDACLDLADLKHSRTGVFVGMSGEDYALAHRHSGEMERIDAYTILGSTLSTAAGRLSYFLGLHGPSLTLDTACSSTLVGLHLACQSLRRKESDMAFVGGANLILSPDIHVCFSKLRAMSPTGSCKTFDAMADGYTRAEGCGFVLLKRLPDAIRDGNRILAVIKGTAVNQDGRTSGLAAPNGTAQQQVIAEALRDAGVTPAQIDYVEAHGTGTPLGDPIEVEALSAVYGVERQARLKLGSVKTNIGHMEPVAGLGGLIKLVQSLRHSELPPSRNFNQPSPHIPWAQLPIQVVTERTPWPRTDRPRMAGLSAFGFSGTNAHVILAEAPAEQPQAHQPQDASYILCLSARDDAALHALASAHMAALPTDATPDGGRSLANWCYAANAGRHHWQHRLALQAHSGVELRRKLGSYLEGRAEPGVVAGHKADDARPRVAFLFTGQGSQYVGMGRQFYETQTAFRDSIDQCDALLRPTLGLSIRNLMFAGDPVALNRTSLCQPALFVLEYALAQLWMSLGVKPVAVMGHSVGEYVAACIAGVFSLEDGLRLIAERGRLMQALPDGGAMAAIAAPAADLANLIAPYNGRISIAAINGPRACVLSGDQDAVDAVVARLVSDGIGITRLNVSHAFHSHRLDPMLAALEQVASGVAFAPSRIKLVSNLSGRVAGTEMTCARYWVDHARHPVAFAAGIQTLIDDGVQHFVEIGPQATLLGMGRQCLSPEAAGERSWLPSLRSTQPNLRAFHQALTALYTSGIDVTWSALYRGQDRRWTSVPHYPFQRRRYWIDLPLPGINGFQPDRPSVASMASSMAPPAS
ncbi:MAG: type I polyketide synthase, partial [Niveispirillum sp.]|nr:type I polyketide synthase [Niveispirillum sp.]